MNKEIMSRFLSRIMIATLCCISYMPTKATVGIQLIGIYNKLTNNSNSPSSNPATVRIKSTREAVTGLPWIPKQFLKLPIEIELLFEAKNLDDKNTPQPYIIRIAEDPSHSSLCPNDKACVVAEVYAQQQGDLDSYPETKQRTCVSKSVFFLKQGDLVSQWQNLMLFIGDPDDASSILPFKFGIAAWTATHGLWKYDFVDYAPTDPKTSAPQVTFEKHAVQINNEEKLKGLRVFQGQQAWGGGRLPRAYHLHIAHVYNNTNYSILVRRTVQELSAYNFDKIIPPYSVMPFALIWIPKITTEQALEPRLDPIRFFVLRSGKPESLPPAFSSLDEIGDTEIGADITGEAIDSSVNNIVQNITVNAQGLSGYGDMIAELKHDPSEQYFVGQQFYKLFAVKGNTAYDPQTLCINRCSFETNSEENIYSHSDPSYQGVNPRYYLRLIINEKKDSTNNTSDLVEFDIANISQENVFEH